MKSALRFFVLSVLVLAVVLLLVSAISSPVIYSLEQDTFSSRFHANTEAQKRQSVNSSEDILPLMQELSGYCGPIVLNVRLHDTELARRDLELFKKNRVAFNNLVVKLDMTESEMQEYAKNRALQDQLLADLVNSSVSLEELKKLEIQYRNENNPGSLMSVQLEGDALHERIQELYDRYEAGTNRTIATGKRVGIDTSQEEESIILFRQYVEETVPTPRVTVALSPARTEVLTLVLLPEAAGFGESVRCFGFLVTPRGEENEGIPDRNVTLFLDNEPVSSGMTGTSGGYSVNLRVERIPAGPHAVQAAAGTTRSAARTLSVEWADSETTLYLSLPSQDGEVTAGGSVSAGVPVRNAPVQILKNGTLVSETTTDGDGWFETSVKLPPGAHVLVARFTGNGFPLRPSESEPAEIEVPLIGLPADISALLPAAAVVITLLLFAGAAFWYLQRMRGRRTSPEITGIQREASLGGTPGTPDPADVFSALKAEIPENLFSRYARVLQEHGLSEAAFTVYRDLSERIARDQEIRECSTLTPRELSRSCRNKPYCGAFLRFVAVYETIRYGGRSTPTVRTEFEEVLGHTEKRMGGSDHEE